MIPDAVANTSPPYLGRGLKLVHKTLRNPIEAIPAEAYVEPLSYWRVLQHEVALVTDPDLIRQVLVSDAQATDKGESVRRPLGAALGDGLLTAEGADWRWQRRAIAPIFRAAGVDRFVPAMLAAAERAHGRLAAAAGPADVNHEMMRTTFDIIAETMLSGRGSIDIDRAGASVTAYLHQTHWANLSSLLGLPDWVPLPGRRRALDAARYLRSEIEGLVAARRAAGDAGGGDLVDLLLAAEDPTTGQRMTDIQITDNLTTFMTAGHETTALALAWTLDLLARHPEIGRRARDEIATVTEGHAVTPDHLPRLAYVRQVLEEAMRLYPPAAMIVRRLVEPMTLGGRTFASGTRILIPVFAVHRHAALWEAPHVFDPDRFSPEAAAARPRYAYLPFGAGPRVCIGSSFAMLEAVAILAVLLRDLRFVSVEAAPPEPRLEITLRPSRPLLLRVERSRLH
ncbi:cytochrome P450 [Enterovirga rhinocerotis]|uniref:Cytochrome P450 n=1 Tax=Enterovirga rhinocerotis TaxID=1339210 RepID=A0A4R7C8T1_9HYPH|nr:cytochrome P450 [Enterovirga rhinocerotis]TDR93725.1 cytochrome P450 [Enterovirga rhinocerotis]